MIRPKSSNRKLVPVWNNFTFSKEAIFDQLPDSAWIYRIDDGIILDMNSAGIKKSGYTRDELIGRSIYDFYYNPQDRKYGENFGRTVQKEGRGLLTVTMRDKAGRPVELELHGSSLPGRPPKAMLVTARDLGETTKEHRRALTFYEAFKRSNDVIFYCDRNAVILDVNDAFTKHYGYTRREVIGKKPNILRSRHSTDELYGRIWSSLLDPQKGYWRGQMINRAKDGHDIPVVLTITTIRDVSGEIVGYISNTVDMTEQLALQARVANSEALASIGEMVAIVAHEIRNPLGSIVMAANQIATGSLAEAERQTVTRVLRTESSRLAETLANFLSYGRPREINLHRSDLNAVVSEVCRMVESNSELIGRIEVRVSLDKALQTFPMDADQIRQVLWNILLNAVQAMKGTGTISVRTGRSAEHAFFRIEDTGPGIPKSALAELFKPFYTTKQQGTGLGLAIAERIVKAHGGRIDAESANRGAAFTVYLPFIEA